VLNLGPEREHAGRDLAARIRSAILDGGVAAAAVERLTRRKRNELFEAIGGTGLERG
jgi:hypothetical protein